MCTVLSFLSGRERLAGSLTKTVSVSDNAGGKCEGEDEGGGRGVMGWSGGDGEGNATRSRVSGPTGPAGPRRHLSQCQTLATS